MDGYTYTFDEGTKNKRMRFFWLCWYDKGSKLAVKSITGVVINAIVLHFRTIRWTEIQPFKLNSYPSKFKYPNVKLCMISSNDMCLILLLEMWVRIGAG